MRITKRQLRQVIKEELAAVLGEEGLFEDDDPKTKVPGTLKTTDVKPSGEDIKAASQKVFDVSDEDQAKADAHIASKKKKKTQVVDSN